MRVAATPFVVAAASLAVCAAAAGCFYVDPINQRPSLDIRTTSSDPVFRNANLRLEAVASDPENQFVSFQWRVYACTDATDFATCDREPVFTGVESFAEFRVPAYRADPDAEGPQLAPVVEALRVVLEGRDDHGATARPEQVLTITVLNHPPELELRQDTSHGSVITTPLEVYAQFSDPDDEAANVTLEWTLFSPSQLPEPLVEIGVPGDPPDQQGMTFTPQVTGNWDLRVIASDRLGTRTEKHLVITVAEDAPPCLDTWDPIASAEAVPITEPTLFRVLGVHDDLDPFPRAVDAPAFVHETTFLWSMKVGGGPRLALSNPLASLALDPQAYALGTILELRVEIFDRKATPITCADGAQTCSVISQPACIQRQTWRVEAR